MMRKFAGFCLLAMLGIIQASSQPVVTPPPFIPPPTGSLPAVSSVCTTQGTTAGGDVVVITGTNLNNVSAVNFGGTSAGTQWYYNSANGTSLVAISPAASAGTVDVKVTTSAGTSAANAGDNYTYITPTSLPTVTFISPDNDILAPAGDHVSIQGTNFTGVTQLHFGSNTTTSFSVNTPTNITTQSVPTGTTGTVNVTVTHPTNGTSTSTCATQFTYGATPPSSTPPPSTATRPSYNTGTGYFVVGRGIYDANGNLFIPIGGNHSTFGANQSANRFFGNPSAERNEASFNNSVASNQAQMNEALNFWAVPIPYIFCIANFTSCTNPSGSINIADLQSSVSHYLGTCGCGDVAGLSAAYLGYNSSMILGLANEWGPCDFQATFSDYLTGYKGVIASLRSAGFTSPIAIDAGCSGQGNENFVVYGPLIQAADPQHNVTFVLHLYNNFYAAHGNFKVIAPTFSQFGRMTIPVYLGEFGCQNAFFAGCSGSSANPNASPAQIIGPAETYQLGWIAWAWDGDCTLNMLGQSGCPNSVDTPTGTTYCYKNAAGTLVESHYGQAVIDDPTVGMKAVSHFSTVFTGTRPTPPACPY